MAKPNVAIPALTSQQIARFHRNTDRRGPDDCWRWRLYLDHNGRGLYRLRPHPGRFAASRVAWVIAHGPIPHGLSVLHRCDNPCCVNPAHLFLGTHKDNTQDMISKGRRGYTGMPGEKHPAAKLTEDQVREIRQKYAAGGTSYPRLAKEYGVSFALVGMIVKRKAWPHIT